MLPLIKQIWIASGTIINMLGQSMVNSYSACLLPALLDPGSSIRVDLDTASWITACMGFSKVLGFPLAAYFMQRFGRPKTFAFLAIPGIVGWLLIYFAADVPALMMGRILGGISTSGCGSVGFIIVGEYSSPGYRGMFMGAKATSAVSAGLLIHVCGRYFSWRTIALIGIVPSVVSSLMALTWPESPSWLIANNRFKEFERNMLSIRGKSDATFKECAAMIQAQNLHLNKVRKSNKEQLRWCLEAFRNKVFLKPVSILVVSFLVVEACGKHVYPAYALDIVSSINGDSSSTFYFTIALDLINILSTSFSCFLIKMVKIRTLLFSTGAAAFTVILSLSLYLFLVSSGMVSPITPLFPISLLAVYLIIVNLACIPLCLALIGELIPLNYRSFGLLVVGFMDALVLSLALKLSPILILRLGIQGMFVVSALVKAAALVYMYFTLPETKGRSLQEIEDFFTHGRFLDSSPDDATVAMLRSVKS